MKAPTSVPFSGGEEGAGRHVLQILCSPHSIDVEIEDLYKTETGSAAVKWTIELQLERVITPALSPALLYVIKGGAKMTTSYSLFPIHD